MYPGLNLIGQGMFQLQFSPNETRRFVGFVYVQFKQTLIMAEWLQNGVTEKTTRYVCDDSWTCQPKDHLERKHREPLKSCYVSEISWISKQMVTYHMKSVWAAFLLEQNVQCYRVYNVSHVKRFTQRRNCWHWRVADFFREGKAKRNRQLRPAILRAVFFSGPEGTKSWS